MAIAYAGSIWIYTLLNPIESVLWPEQNEVYQRLPEDQKSLISLNESEFNSTNFQGFGITHTEGLKAGTLQLYIDSSQGRDQVDETIQVYLEIAIEIQEERKAMAYVYRFLLTIIPIGILYLLLRNKFHAKQDELV